MVRLLHPEDGREAQSPGVDEAVHSLPPADKSIGPEARYYTSDFELQKHIMKILTEMQGVAISYCNEAQDLHRHTL